MTQPAATDVRTAAANIIEPHLTGTFKRRQRAEDNAQDLADSGILVHGTCEQAANVLQCRNDWKTAETIAAELDAAGLLKGQ